ncbi:MAG: ammonia-forming cytochrome c nitrite reductase subunit c552, partial [Bacillota bacterium]|nr:ammonia-forming cytochrome c nitrite reductase subunit c552 [Bacillota bacterium]
RQGKDINEVSDNEMRTLVCAQCHVEYYFESGTKKVIYPWDNGEKIEDVYEYYEEIGFNDFTHGITGGDMLKMQHPDYELFLNSTHYANGVSCADCHMPYQVEDGVKYSSHYWTSPLKDIESSCLQCHSDNTAEEMRDRVIYTQDRVWEIQDTAGKTIEKAISDIKAAEDSGNADAETLAEAKELHRKAQAFWDWIAAENSRGFHNSQDAMNTLAKAIDYAHQATEKAEASY